jgi:hypothetical protein
MVTAGMQVLIPVRKFLTQGTLLIYQYYFQSIRGQHRIKVKRKLTKVKQAM